MSTAAVAGTVIEGKYRLERELGAGGMGSVWLATQLMVDRNVAVKLLHPAFVDSDDIQARFEVEAKAIGRLHHPNCITLFDFGFSDDLRAFYTVIEYIDGTSLDKKLSRRIPLKEAVGTIRQIAMALGHAHHQGILHRDLKPENVMVSTMTDGSEMVKVLDFGIARIVKGDAEPGSETSEQHRLTKAGEVFGTPAYMSPEQARSTRSLTPAADLYSLGVMFYELVTGGLPFFANSAFDLLMMHVTRPVPPIDRAGVPDELKQLIYRLLEKEPEKRFQSGPELVTAIDALELPDESQPEMGDDDFEAGPTRITPPPSKPLTPVPASVAPPDSSDEMGGFPAEDTLVGTPPAAGQAGQSGAFPASHSGSFPASQSGAFQASQSGAFAASQSGAFPASQSGAFAASQSGAFPATQSGAFPAESGGQAPSHDSGRFTTHHGANPTLGGIDMGGRRKLLAALVGVLLIIMVFSVVIAVAFFSNGDASADQVTEPIATDDPFLAEPEFAPGDNDTVDTPENLELAAGADDDADAGNDTPEEPPTEIAPNPEDTQDEAAVEPTPKKTVQKRPRRKTRTRTTRTKTESKPPKKDIIELSIDEKDDAPDPTKVEELSLD